MFCWTHDPLQSGGLEAFATRHSDGRNMPRSDLEERCCITTLHFKHKGCFKLNAFLWVLKGGPLTGEDISFWVAQQVAVSPCWYFANHTSRDDMLHEGHRTGHSPASKSPAPAQPGTLAASCILPVSLPVCEGRACHPILKSRHHFPLQFINVQLSQHASG